MAILDRIDSPEDVKRLDGAELQTLAAEIRARLVAVCANNGGHLAPNLGVVELTIALHYVLDTPNDAIVWDVGHQAYVHKLLTGRRDRIDTLRREGGLSGFTNRAESPFDAFGAGHASTSVSAALGIALARDLRGEKRTVVAVLGDGALTGGLAYEALNNAGVRRTNLIVILNDNEMSIAPNVGSIASYLSRLRSKPFFTHARVKAKEMLQALPFGNTARKAITSAEVAAMRFVAPDAKAPVIFEEMGFHYIGPIDGHDIATLTDVLQDARQIDGPVLIHVRTIKGKGFEPAENDARTFHGCGSFRAEDGVFEKAAAGGRTFSDAFGETLTTLAERDSRIIGFTAAMPDGTKLSTFARRFPERSFDVGIAEAHAVCAAAGAAAAGMRPVCAIYSTFLQRAYDQIVHDVVVQKLPVLFAIDRAGFVGDDGPTHMGIYDIPMLRTLPQLPIAAPRSPEELNLMLAHLAGRDFPAAIRYPRGTAGNAVDAPPAPIDFGRAEILHRGSGIAVFALGPLCDEAFLALRELGDAPPTIVNPRFVVPLDTVILRELCADHHTIITMEEGSLAGGFGSAVLEAISALDLPLRVVRLGIGAELVAQASIARQREGCGVDARSLVQAVRRARITAIKEPTSCQVPPQA